MTEVVATLALQLDLRGFTPGAEKRLLTLEKALIGIERASRAAAPALNMFTLALKGTLAPAQQLTAALPAISSAFKGQSQFASRYATSLSRVATAAAAAAQNLNTIPRNLPFPPGQGGGGGAGGGSKGMELGGYVGLSPGGLFSGMMLRGAGAGIAGVAMAAQAGFSAVSALGEKFSQLAAGALESTKNLEGARSALTAVTGSTALADAELQGVIQTAQRFATPIKDAAQQYARLMAAAGDNQRLKDSAKETFEAVMLSARSMNLGGEQVSGILTALEQIMSKGKLQAEELRKQLGNRLPGAFRIAAESMGMTTAQLDKALKEGKISAEQFFQGFAQGLRKNFAGGVEVALGSLTSLQTRLENVQTLLGAEFATQFFAPFEKAETLATITGMEKMLLQMQGSQEAIKNLGALGMVWGSLKVDVFNAGSRFVQMLANSGAPVAAILEKMSSVKGLFELITRMGVYDFIPGTETALKTQLRDRQAQLDAAAELMLQLGSALAPTGPQLGKDWVFGAFSAEQLEKEAQKRREANKEGTKTVEITAAMQRETKRQVTLVEQLVAQYVRLSSTASESDMFKVMKAGLSPEREGFARTIVGMTDVARAAKEIEKDLTKLDEKYVKLIEDANKPFSGEGVGMLGWITEQVNKLREAASRPPDLTGLQAIDAEMARIWRRYGRKEDTALEDAFAARARSAKGSRIWQMASEDIEAWQRSVDKAYGATREFEEFLVQDLGQALADSPFVENSRELEELWKNFGRTATRAIMDLIIQLMIVTPLMEKLKAGSGSGFSGWLSSLFSFGGSGTAMGSNGPMSTVRGAGGPASGPISITINAAPGGGTPTSVSTTGGEAELARQVESLVIATVARQSRPAGKLAYLGRSNR